MDRKQLHALIDLAIDAVTCDECRETLIEEIGMRAVRLVGAHTAQSLGNLMMDGTLTTAQTYDRLADTMHPLYAAMGEEIPPEMNAEIRASFLASASRGLN